MIKKYGYYCHGLAPADTQASGSVAIKDDEFPRIHFSLFLKEEEPECLGPSPWTSNAVAMWPCCPFPLTNATWRMSSHPGNKATYVTEA